ncbi:MAG: hypothetical protein DCC49_09085 [Acidobacteria bacterium]|nr:MAG: hypothetical protein DCC49_09085 [Acidobacteriota bacterium]
MADAILEAATERYLDVVKSYSPVTASQLGLHERDGELDVLDAGTASAEARDLSGLLRTLGKASHLFDPDDQIDAAVLTSMIQTRLLELESERQWERNPDRHLEVLLEGAFALVQRDYAPLATRAKCLTDRLTAGVGLLQNMRSTISDPPSLWVENAIATAEAGPRFLEGPVAALAEQLSTSGSESLASELMRASQEISNQLVATATWMRDDLLPRASGHWAAGEELMAARLIREHGLALTPAEVMEAGRQLVDEVSARLEEEAGEECRARGIEGGWRELLEVLKSNCPEPAELLPLYQSEMERSLEWVQGAGVAPVPQDSPLIVEATPVFLRHLVPFAAYSPPGPFESMQSGFFWITPPESPEAMRDHCVGTPPLIAAHEGYPGHHLQLSLANQLDRTLRRLQWSTLLIEGWGFYCEQLLADSGIGGSEAKLLGLKDQLWRACRVVLDVGIHSGEMGFDEAVEMLVEVAGLELEGAEAEVRRYTSSPGYQLCYAMGKRAITELRESARTRLGASFDIGLFHKALLGYGSIPPALFADHLLASVEPAGEGGRDGIGPPAQLAGDPGGSARDKLLARITAINERCWLAIWKYDIEFELWEMALDATGGSYGMSEVSAEELAELVELAEESGGWYVDLCEAPLDDQVLTFMPLDEWRERWREIGGEVRARRISDQGSD